MKRSRQAAYWLVMVLCLIGSACYFFVILPLKQQTEALQEELRREQTILSKLAHASAEHRDTPSAAFPPLYQAQIPESPYLERIMLDLTQVETVSGVDMEGIGLSTSDPEEKEEQTVKKEVLRFPPIGSTATDDSFAYPGLEKIAISTNLKGTFEQIHRFFEEALRLPRVMRVERVKIASSGDSFLYFHPKDEEHSVLTAEVTFSAYYAPQLKPFFPQPLPVIVPPPDGRKNPFH